MPRGVRSLRLQVLKFIMRVGRTWSFSSRELAGPKSRIALREASGILRTYVRLCVSGCLLRTGNRSQKDSHLDGPSAFCVHLPVLGAEERMAFTPNFRNVGSLAGEAAV